MNKLLLGEEEKRKEKSMKKTSAMWAHVNYSGGDLLSLSFNVGWRTHSVGVGRDAELNEKVETV